MADTQEQAADAPVQGWRRTLAVAGLGIALGAFVLTLLLVANSLLRSAGELYAGMSASTFLQISRVLSQAWAGLLAIGGVVGLLGLVTGRGRRHRWASGLLVLAFLLALGWTMLVLWLPFTQSDAAIAFVLIQETLELATMLIVMALTWGSWTLYRRVLGEAR